MVNNRAGIVGLGIGGTIVILAFTGIAKRMKHIIPFAFLGAVLMSLFNRELQPEMAFIGPLAGVLIGAALGFILDRTSSVNST